ncbi:MAG: mevalonate kinase [Candidatus Aenigmarchaeota archaeon]|nr:mevalonate kinase [Candidatus Aenigmarchaeota archaeon]
MRKTVKVSAPGKIHMIGEHAAVYGKPAIIAAIDKRCYVRAEKNDSIIIKSRELSSEQKFEIKDVLSITRKIRDLHKRCSEKNDFSELFKLLKNDQFTLIKAAIGDILLRLNINHGIFLDIKSDILIGSGLGSSSALAVAITKAISELYEKKLSVEEVNNIAFGIEQFSHGTPSGGDNSACCFGGLIWFQKSAPKNIIKSLKKEIPYKLRNFILVYTKKPEKTTGELVQMVRNLNEDFRNERINALRELTYEMREALKNKNFKRMKEIINMAQKNLSELGLSVKEIDDVYEHVKNIAGAAKLCGAGGGGAMLCYHEDKSKLIDTIKSLGYKYWETELGVDGVRIENE